MKKGWIYACLLGSALLIPNRGMELGKMKPVETVCIQYQDDLIVVSTDTEDVGIGSTLDEAIVDLRATTAGRIYLDTANYLLVDPDAYREISVMAKNLKGNVRLCAKSGDMDLKEVGAYLQVHTPKMKLKDWKQGAELPLLKTENGRIKMS